MDRKSAEEIALKLKKHNKDSKRIDQGDAWAKEGLWGGAVRKYTEAIDSGGLRREVTAMVLCRRADAWRSWADFEQKILSAGVAHQHHTPPTQEGVNQKYQSASKDYTEALNSNYLPPEMATLAFLGRAHVKQQLGDFRGAADDYAAVLTADLGPKEHAQTQVQLGTSLKQCGDYEAAELHLTAALDSQQLSAERVAEAHYARATSRHLRGEYTGAIEDYSALLNPAHSQASKWKERLITAIGFRSREPEERFRASAHVGRAHCHHKIKNFVASIADFTRALDLHKNISREEKARMYYYRGSARLQSGRAAEAIEDFKATLKRDCNFRPTAQFELGLALESLGKHAEATAAFQAVANMDKVPDEIVSRLARRGIVGTSLAQLEAALTTHQGDSANPSQSARSHSRNACAQPEQASHVPPLPVKTLPPSPQLNSFENRMTPLGR